MRDYTKIKAWALADDLAVDIYKQTREFPSDEKFALTSQLRRACYSVPANISEGAGRRTTKGFVRFLDMAMGSANEVNYLVFRIFLWRMRTFRSLGDYNECLQRM